MWVLDQNFRDTTRLYRSNFKCLSVPSFFGSNENLIYKMDIMFYSIRCETSIRDHKPISNSEMRL